MSNILDETFYLRTGELNLLLAGKGMRQIYMLQSDELDMDEAGVCLTLNQLYNNELLHTEEETFVIDGALNELLDIVCQADNVMFLRAGCRESAATCLFIRKGRMVSLALSATDKSAYRINEVDETMLSEFCEEYCSLEGQCEPVLDEEDVFGKLCKNRDSVSNADIRGYRNVILLAEQLQNEDGRVSKRMILRYVSGGQQLLIIEGGRMKLELDEPSVQQCVEQLVSMCRREETKQ